MNEDSFTMIPWETGESVRKKSWQGATVKTQEGSQKGGVEQQRLKRGRRERAYPCVGVNSPTW